jgi:hypothetical protein
MLRQKPEAQQMSLLEKAPAKFECSGDALWGADAIAAYLNVPRPKFNHLFQTGMLAGAVQKWGHRTIVGSKKKLDALIAGDLGKGA